MVPPRGAGAGNRNGSSGPAEPSCGELLRTTPPSRERPSAGTLLLRDSAPGTLGRGFARATETDDSLAATASPDVFNMPER